MQNYNIILKRYNGVDYDTLLPKSTMSTTVTLTANGWLNNSQTVLISSSIGVTATSLVLVSPNPSDFSIMEIMEFIVLHKEQIL